MASIRDRAQRLKSALLVWAALLALNGVFGLAYVAFEFEDLWIELGVSLLGLALVIPFGFHDVSLRQWLQKPKKAMTWAFVPVVWLSFAVGMALYFWVLGFLGAEEINMAELYAESNQGWLLPVILVILLPPLTEEWFFRGVLQTRLAAVMGQREALVVQAALFSVLHMLPLIFLSHFLMGIALGWLRNRSGSLWPSILVHTLWNAWVMGEGWLEMT